MESPFAIKINLFQKIIPAKRPLNQPPDHSLIFSSLCLCVFVRELLFCVSVSLCLCERTIPRLLSFLSVCEHRFDRVLQGSEMALDCQ